MLLKLFKLAGHSMWPAYRSADYVLVLRHRWQRLKRGDVVVIRHTSLGCIIKRIHEIAADGSLRLAGDHAQLSTSSEAMGPVVRDQVVGKVIWHLPRSRFAAD